MLNSTAGIDPNQPVATTSLGQGVGTSTPAYCRIANPPRARTIAANLSSVDLCESSNRETRNVIIPAPKKKYPIRLVIVRPVYRTN